jgi:hypothetical protein
MTPCILKRFSGVLFRFVVRNFRQQCIRRYDSRPQLKSLIARPLYSNDPRSVSWPSTCYLNYASLNPRSTHARQEHA